MSPLSAPVLGTSALLASPALYRGFVIDTMPLGVVLERYLITAAICWVALSLVAGLVFSNTAHGTVPEPEPAPVESRPVREGDDTQPLAG